VRRYYVKVVAGEIVERRLYDTPTAPSGFTEVTHAQFEGTSDPTRVYTYSGGAVSASGDRPFVWDGVEDTLGPDRPDAYIDP